MNNCIVNQFGCSCETRCKLHRDPPKPISRVPEYLAAAALIIIGVFLIGAIGYQALERVEASYQLEARV